MAKIQYISHLVKVFKQLLQRHGVENVYQAIYYDSVGLAINAAASKVGIPSFCVQHGAQTRSHPAFGQWNNVPATGFEMLPDTFLCWNETAADAIRLGRAIRRHTRHWLMVIGG